MIYEDAMNALFEDEKRRAPTITPLPDHHRFTKCLLSYWEHHHPTSHRIVFCGTDIENQHCFRNFGQLVDLLLVLTNKDFQVLLEPFENFEKKLEFRQYMPFFFLVHELYENNSEEEMHPILHARATVCNLQAAVKAAIDKIRVISVGN